MVGGRTSGLLKSKIDARDVYVKTAPGQDVKDYNTGEPIFYKPSRNLYGLAQSPVLRYETTTAEMLQVGLKPTQSEPCDTYARNDTLAILTLYVDYILITGNNENVVGRLRKALTGRFAISEIGEVILILDMTVTRDYEKGLFPSPRRPTSATYFTGLG